MGVLISRCDRECFSIAEILIKRPGLSLELVRNVLPSVHVRHAYTHMYLKVCYESQNICTKFKELCLLH